MRIREFDTADLNSDFLKLFNNPSIHTSVLTYVLRLIQFGDRRIFVAEDENGKIVGTITVSFTRSFDDFGKPKAFLNSLKVDENHRKKGIGTNLVKRALDAAIEANATHITLASSDINKKWYESLGFTHKYYHMVKELI